MDEKISPNYIHSEKKTHFKYNDIHRVKVKVWKKIYHANSIQNQAKVTILISGKVTLEIRKLRRYEE